MAEALFQEYPVKNKKTLPEDSLCNWTKLPWNSILSFKWKKAPKTQYPSFEPYLRLHRCSKNINWLYVLIKWIQSVSHSVLPGESHAWRSLVGCQSMGSHRVRHDLSDLAAAAAVTQSRPALYHPTLYHSLLLYRSSQAFLSMKFSRQEYWSGLPFPSPGDLPDSGI